jgi:hypothetical protein
LREKENVLPNVWIVASLKVIIAAKEQQGSTKRSLDTGRSAQKQEIYKQIFPTVKDDRRRNKGQIVHGRPKCKVDTHLVSRASVQTDDLQSSRKRTRNPTDLSNGCHTRVESPDSDLKSITCVAIIQDCYVNVKKLVVNESVPNATPVNVDVQKAVVTESVSNAIPVNVDVYKAVVNQKAVVTESVSNAMHLNVDVQKAVVTESVSNAMHVKVSSSSVKVEQKDDNITFSSAVMKAGACGVVEAMMDSSDGGTAMSGIAVATTDVGVEGLSPPVQKSIENYAVFRHHQEPVSKSSPDVHIGGAGDTVFGATYSNMPETSPSEDEGDDGKESTDKAIASGIILRILSTPAIEYLFSEKV